MVLEQPHSKPWEEVGEEEKVELEEVRGVEQKEVEGEEEGLKGEVEVDLVYEKLEVMQVKV